MTDHIQAKQKQRQRAAHKKSGNGCITCKTRHVRCDERREGGCVRCERSGRECGGYEDKSSQRRFQFKAFKTVTFDHDESSSTTSSDRTESTEPLDVVQFVHRPLAEFATPAPFSTGDSLALEFFGRKTIPLLSRFCYPSLWSGPTMHFIHSTPVLRQIALAVGSQHLQLTEAGEDLPSSHGSTSLAISNSYFDALRSLRKVILEKSSNSTVVVLLACLLLVLHDSLGIRRNDFLVHLYNGLRLIGEDQDLHKSDIGAELITTFRRLGLNSLLIKPNQNTFKLLLDTRPVVIADDQKTAQLDQIRTAIDDVSAGCFGFVSKVAFHLHSSSEEALTERDALQARLEPIRAALAAYDAVNHEPQGAESFMRPVIEARSILATVFLKAVMTGYQTTYDKYLNDFKKIISLMRNAIEIIRRDYEPDDSGHMQLFSLDLGIISTLGYTGGQCRDSKVRRDCMELLQLGPSRDGAWDKVSTFWSIWHKTRFEERLADNFDDQGHCIFIPEDCRIMFTDSIEPCEENGYIRQLFCQWRPKANCNELGSHIFNLE